METCVLRAIVIDLANSMLRMGEVGVALGYTVQYT